MTASFDTDAQTELYGVAIIGAGLCGLAMAARLREKHPSALFTDEEQARYSWISRNAAKAAIKKKKTGDVKTASCARSQDSGPSMLVLDGSGDQWMAKWNALFKKLEISHLRSPMFFHTDPLDRDALLAFAHEQDRMAELQEIPGCVGHEISKHQRKKKTKRAAPGPKTVVEVDERDRKDYFTPSTSCFNDFCEQCIQRYSLQDLIRRESVTDLDYGIFPHVDKDAKVFRISTSHAHHFARAVVLAIGGGKPVIPAPFPQKLPPAASHALSFEENLVLSRQLQQKVRARQHTTALVVGGGLTSAQIADGLVRKGVSEVHLVMRGPWKVKPFDVDLSWMSKFRNQQRAAFWTADSLEERLEQAKVARNGGSMTPRFSKKLKAHVQTGRLHVHAHTIIASQSFNEQSGCWSLQTEPAVAGMPLVDHIIFATGAQLDVRDIDLLTTMRRKYPIETFGGFPALDDDLQWAEDVPLFLTGKLATLQIGPGAANLEGARMCAERIAWAIGGMLDGAERGLVDDGKREAHRHRYIAGVGSRYDQLGEDD